MVLTFYFVRHGETLFNQLGLVQGACDSPLTAQGIAEANKAREALMDIPFTKAYSSTSERAFDTANIILKDKPVQLQLTKGLKEFDFGLFDGSKVSEVLEEMKRRDENVDFRDVGGDSAETIKERILTTMKKIKENCVDGDIVLLVSHGAYCRYVIKYLFGLDPYEVIQNKKALIPNGGIMKFVWEDHAYRLLVAPVAPEEFGKEVEL